jgi:signal peptidase II
LLLVTILGTVACDRLSKNAASAALAGGPGQSFLFDTVRLQYAENTGGFLGVGGGWPSSVRTAFVVGTGLALFGMVMVVLRAQSARLTMLALALFIGGGASNVFDRIMAGRVVDFMNVGVGPLRTGIFNLADIAIMAGAAIFIFDRCRGQASSPIRN